MPVILGRGLDTLLDFELVAGFPERLLDGRDEVVDVLVAHGDVALDALGDAAVILGLLVAEPDVLHLGLDAVQAYLNSSSKPFCSTVSGLAWRV